MNSRQNILQRQHERGTAERLKKAAARKKQSSDTFPKRVRSGLTIVRQCRVLHSGRFVYRQCSEALQARHAVQKLLMQMTMRLGIQRSCSMIVRLLALALLLISCGSDATHAGQQSAQAGDTPKKLEISRTARPLEFLAAVGKRAGLLGNESGRVEAWVYPLKILRDLKLTVLTEGREIPAETLVRTVIARPESTTLVYTGDTFSIRETFFVPVDQPGAVIEIQVETEQPLELQASFIRDFQLEWPASMGGTYVGWSSELHGFVFGEDQ